MNDLSVAIRVDATPRIGTGHLMRCLTLARLLKQRGAHIRFVSRDILDSMREQLALAGMEYRPLPESDSEAVIELNSPVHAQWLGASQATDARQTQDALADRTWDWLVVDHYAIDQRWEQAMTPLGARLLCIDDLADRFHTCDLLLDQNFYAGAEKRYQGKLGMDCRLLCGPGNALLRDEFLEQQPRVRVRQGLVRRLLIFFGGVDLDNITERAIDALAQLPSVDFAVDVVIGAQHPARVRIEARCDDRGYHCHVQTSRMAELMAGADLALGGGGATNIERAAMGLPALVTILADNQRQTVRDMAEAGLLIDLGDAENLDAEAICIALRAILPDEQQRSLLSQRGLALVPSHGQHPLLEAMGLT